LYIIIWVVLAFFVGYLANKKGRSFFGYFILALILSPLVGFIILLVVGEDEDSLIAQGRFKKCPKCKGKNDIDAEVCKHCGNNLKKSIVELKDKDSLMYILYISKDINFNYIKNKIFEYFNSLNFTNVVKDKEKFYQIRNDKANAYILLKEKDDKLYLELFRVNEPNFINKIKKNTKIDNSTKSELTERKIDLRETNSDNNDKTKKLVELKDMLEKDLITKDEFDKLKKEIIEGK